MQGAGFRGWERVGGEGDAEGGVEAGGRGVSNCVGLKGRGFGGWRERVVAGWEGEEGWVCEGRA